MKKSKSDYGKKPKANAFSIGKPGYWKWNYLEFPTMDKTSVTKLLVVEVSFTTVTSNTWSNHSVAIHPICKLVAEA